MVVTTNRFCDSKRINVMAIGPWRDCVGDCPGDEN
jgi:hypothetical protein